MTTVPEVAPEREAQSFSESQFSKRSELNSKSISATNVDHYRAKLSLDRQDDSHRELKARDMSHQELKAADHGNDSQTQL